MKLGITTKLFFAFLVTNVAIAVAFVVALSWSVDRGFRDYVETRDARRMAAIAENLSAAYAEHGSWDFLRANTALWNRLGRADVGDDPPHPPLLVPGRRADEPGRFPPPEGPPSRGWAPELESDARREHRPPPGGAEGRPPPGAPHERGPRLPMLVDADRKLVVGDETAHEGARTQPIAVEGVTVGWLVAPPVRLPLGVADARFLDDQRRASFIIGAVAVVLAAGVAIVLARSLLAPVRRIAQATHRLAAGDYTARVTATTRDELGRLVTDFNQLAEKLDQTERMRRNFLADISHELRTPLAVLRGELEAFEDGIHTLTPESLRSLQSEVATLSVLIDDLYDLALADIGALSYRFEPVDVVALVDDALHAFRERLSARSIGVETDWHAESRFIVDGDPRRLTQVVNNVLENSVRYTAPGGRLRVALRREGERLHMDFQDSAPGIPSESLPRLFDRLFRVEDSRNRETGGAGLGLALSQSIVVAHRGDIRALASPLGGVWIAIQLPLASAESDG